LRAVILGEACIQALFTFCLLVYTVQYVPDVRLSVGAKT